MTPEKREKLRQYTAARRAKETPEKRAARLEYQREYERQKRAGNPKPRPEKAPPKPKPHRKKWAGMETRDTGRRGRTVSISEFKQLWADTSLTLEDIGRRLDVSKMAVIRRARSRGLGSRKRPAPALDIVLACELFPYLQKAGATQRALARYYKVKTFTIYRAAKRLGLEWQKNSKAHRPTLGEAMLVAKMEKSRNERQ